MIRAGSFAMLMRMEAEKKTQGEEQGMRLEDFYASENPQFSDFAYEMDEEEPQSQDSQDSSATTASSSHRRPHRSWSSRISTMMGRASSSSSNRH